MSPELVVSLVVFAAVIAVMGGACYRGWRESVAARQMGHALDPAKTAGGVAGKWGNMTTPADVTHNFNLYLDEAGPHYTTAYSGFGNQVYPDQRASVGGPVSKTTLPGSTPGAGANPDREIEPPPDGVYYIGNTDAYYRAEQDADEVDR